MSLSEIFNHGAPIPWANLRCNNLISDGSLVSNGNLIVNGTFIENIPAVTPGGAVGQSTTFFGTLRLTGVTPVTAISYSFPISPNNGASNIIFITLFKGGPVGSTNNAMVQTTQSLFVTTAGTTLSHTAYAGGGSNNSIGFGAGVGQIINVSSGNVQFQVVNPVAAQTTDVIWFLTVETLSTTL